MAAHTRGTVYMASGKGLRHGADAVAAGRPIPGSAFPVLVVPGPRQAGKSTAYEDNDISRSFRTSLEGVTPNTCLYSRVNWAWLS